MTSSDDLVIAVRAARGRAGWSQAGLAERVGLSRQSLSAIEAGRQIPSTAVALRLGRALGCSVEQLFRLTEPPPLDAELVAERAAAAPGTASCSARVALGRVGGRWVAHRLRPGAVGAADGLVTGSAQAAGHSRIAPLVTPRLLEHNVLVAGCAPLLGALGGRMTAVGAGALRWIMAGSGRALDMLAHDRVHVAGSHLVDEQGRSDNLRAARERLAGRRLLAVGLVRWRQGLLVAAGNPLGIAEPADLLRPGLRVARREPGAGASKLLARAIGRAGGDVAQLGPGPWCADHLAVGRAVAMGSADAGVAVEAVARALALDFVPLALERFDLILPAEQADRPAVARLLSELQAPALRREAAALGYDPSPLGKLVAAEGAR